MHAAITKELTTKGNCRNIANAAPDQIQNRVKPFGRAATIQTSSQANSQANQNSSRGDTAAVRHRLKPNELERITRKIARDSGTSEDGPVARERAG